MAAEDLLNVEAGSQAQTQAQAAAAAAATTAASVCLPVLDRRFLYDVRRY